MDTLDPAAVGSDEYTTEGCVQSHYSSAAKDANGTYVPDNRLSAWTGYECVWGAEYLTKKGSLERLGQLFEYRLHSNASWDTDRLVGRNISFNARPIENVNYGESVGELDSDLVEEQLDTVRDSLLRAVREGEMIPWDDHSYWGAVALAEALLIVDKAVDVPSGVAWVASVHIIQVFIVTDEGNETVESRLVVLPNYRGDKVLLMELEAGRELLKATKTLYEQAE